MTDTQLNSVARAVNVTATRTPNDPALIYPDMTITYASLWRAVGSFTARLRMLGVNEASTIHVNTRDTAIIIPALLASSVLGARFLQNVGSINQPNLPTITHAFFGPDIDGDNEGVPIGMDWLDHPNGDPVSDVAFAEGDMDADWLIVYTSGTTGVPKFVPLSQRMVCLRSMAIADEFVDGETRLVSLYPNDSRPFLARALAALIHGAAIIDASHAPNDWHWLGVTRVYGSAAAILGALKGVHLTPKLPIVEVAGSQLTEADITSIMQNFEVVDDTYGATETNKSYSTIWRLGPNNEPQMAGQMRDSEIEIVAADGGAVGPGSEGIVRVRNAYLARAYLGDPVASAEVFRDGWFYPGDRGQWGSDGRLILSGRKHDVVNRDGGKLSLSQIDQMIATDVGIVSAACFPSPKEGAENSLIAFIVPAEGANVVQASARAQKLCVDQLGPKFAPTRFWPVQAIPLGPDGKPDRKACTEAIRSAINKNARGPKPEARN